MSKKAFEEIAIFVLLGIIFTGVYVFLLIHFASAYGYMAKNNLFLFVCTNVTLASSAVSWVQSLKHADDPNYDYWRKILFISLAIGIAIFGAYAAQHAMDVSDHIAVL